jgi:hypothetical protein
MLARMLVLRAWPAILLLGLLVGEPSAAVQRAIARSVAPPLDAPTTTALLEAATDLIGRRVGALLTPAGAIEPPVAALPVTESAAVAADERTVLDAMRTLRAELAAKGEEYDWGSAKLTLISTTVSGMHAQFNVEEHGRMHVAREAADFVSEWSASRRFIFDWDGRQWILVGQTLLGQGVPPIDEMVRPMR